MSIPSPFNPEDSSIQKTTLLLFDKQIVNTFQNHNITKIHSLLHFKNKEILTTMLHTYRGQYET